MRQPTGEVFVGVECGEVVGVRGESGWGLMNYEL